MKIRSERGGSAVEFAIVLPLLLLITFGIIEFSIILYDKAVITNASREGARAGIAYDTYDDGTPDGVYRSPTADEIRTIIATYLDCPGNDITKPPLPPRLVNFTAANIATVNVDPNVIIGPRKYLEVTVNYPYDFLVFPDLSGLFGGNFNGTMNLSATTVMRFEEN